MEQLVELEEKGSVKEHACDCGPNEGSLLPTSIDLYWLLLEESGDVVESRREPFIGIPVQVTAGPSEAWYWTALRVGKGQYEVIRSDVSRRM
jgi:hypothetical protein